MKSSRSHRSHRLSCRIDRAVMLPLISLVLCHVGTDADRILTRPELSIEERRRRDKRTPRIAIKKHPCSSFLHLFNGGNDQALLNCCGVDHAIFKDLLEIFEPVFDDHLPDKKTGLCRKVKRTSTGKVAGRPREIDATGCLGLVLFWFRTRGSAARVVPMAFGLTATVLHKWLKFSRHVLLCALHDHPLAKV